MPSDNACVLGTAIVVWSGTIALFFGAGWHWKSFHEKCSGIKESDACDRMQFEIVALMMVGGIFLLGSLILACIVRAVFCNRSAKVEPQPASHVGPAKSNPGDQVTVFVSAC